MLDEFICLFWRQKAELLCSGRDACQVKSHAVISDAEVHLAAVLLCDGDGHRPTPRLVFALALRRRFDTMIDAVSHDMDERIFHLLQNPSVDLDLASLNDHLHLFATIPRQV